MANVEKPLLILAHGAGLDRNAPLLVAIEAALAQSVSVTRINLPFRDARPKGPPRPGDAERDREGLRNAVQQTGSQTQVYVGGHSYGGRQASILCSEHPDLAAGLLLVSYPLHPPDKPEQLRTAHFRTLQTPVLFVHGTRDPFGTPGEMRAALEAIPARKSLVLVDGAAHDMAGAAARIADAFRGFFGITSGSL